MYHNSSIHSPFECQKQIIHVWTYCRALTNQQIDNLAVRSADSMRRRSRAILEFVLVVSRLCHSASLSSEGNVLIQCKWRHIVWHREMRQMRSESWYSVGISPSFDKRLDSSESTECEINLGVGNHDSRDRKKRGVMVEAVHSFW
jgi:hypothetical protein